MQERFITADFTAASKGLVMSIFSNTFLLSGPQLYNWRFRGKQTGLILVKSLSSKALHESKQYPVGRHFVQFLLKKKKRKKK